MSDWTPGSLLWTFTENCNLDCHYCYVRHRCDAVETERRHAIAAELSSYDFESVCFTGGDPLTAWDDLREMLPYFEEQKILIDTNGAFLTDEIAAELAEHDVNVEMTLNGPTAAVHDVSRGEGAFDAMIEAVEHLRAHDISYSFGTTLLPSNIDRVEETIARAVELGGDTIGVNGYMPVVSMTDEYELLLEPADYREALQDVRRCHDEYDEIGVHAGTTLPFAFLLDEPQCEAFRMGGEHVSVCAMGRSVYVTPTGDLVPCLYIRDELGNVLEDDLETVMHDEQAARYREIADTGERVGSCGSCLYSEACGGCPAISAAVHDRPDAGDPRCWVGTD